MKNKFEIGDIVEVTYSSGNLQMERGKVVDVALNNVCVEFFKKFNYMHDCNGKGKNRHCWWIDNSWLMLVKNKKHLEQIEFHGDKTTFIDASGKKFSTQLAKGDKYSKEVGVLMCIAKANGYTYKDIERMAENAKVVDDKELKVGDKVFVNYTIPYGTEMPNGIYLPSEMEIFNHKIYKIKTCFFKDRYRLDKCSTWNFHPDWLIKVEK